MIGGAGATTGRGGEDDPSLLGLPNLSPLPPLCGLVGVVEWTMTALQEIARDQAAQAESFSFMGQVLLIGFYVWVGFNVVAFVWTRWVWPAIKEYAKAWSHH